MSRIRSSSAAHPSDPVERVDPVDGTGDARLVIGRYRLLERARLLGVAPAPATTLDGPDELAHQAGAVAARLAQQGVGRAAATLALSAPRDADVIERLIRAIDASPLPDREWPPLRLLLGDELLGALVGVSQSSLLRYATGARPTPDLVAARLHVVAMACADLRGGYNDYGIRRWFIRSRPSLEGAAVIDVLGPSWDPDGPAAVHLREMAASVLSVGAT